MRKKLYRRLLIILVFVYAIFTLANQQKTLNQYNKTSKELSTKIVEQQSQKKELEEKNDNVNSKEFVEQTARDMLDMYYPNEKIYLDKGM